MNATITDTPMGPRIHVPMDLKRRSGRKRIIMPVASDATTQGAQEAPAGPTYRDAVVIAIARAFRWKKLLDEGRYGSIREMSVALGIEPAYMARLMRLTCLAPDIIDAIVNGLEPDGLSLNRLCRPAPVLWKDQSRSLGEHRDVD